MKNISAQTETDNSADITERNWRTERMQRNEMPRSVPGTPDIQSKWSQRIGSPKSIWGKLIRSRLPGSRVQS